MRPPAAPAWPHAPATAATPRACWQILRPAPPTAVCSSGLGLRSWGRWLADGGVHARPTARLLGWGFTCLCLCGCACPPPPNTQQKLHGGMPGWHVQLPQGLTGVADAHFTLFMSGPAAAQDTHSPMHIQTFIRSEPAVSAAGAQLSRECSSVACSAPHWHTGAWRNCNATCGGGIAKRSGAHLSCFGRSRQHACCWRLQSTPWLAKQLLEP